MKRDTLFIILLLAFVVRFAVSFHEGYGFDIGVYQGWAQSAVEYGLPESYSMQIGGNMLPDYPPVSLTILSGFGHVYKILFHEFDMGSVGYRMYIKLPAIFADLLICALLFVAMSRWKTKREGYIAATAYALNPAAIYDSAIWGQTDAIYSLLLLAAVFAWTQKRYDLSAVILALSIMTKMQAIVLFPLFGFLLLREPRKLLRFAIVGILTIIVVLIPFILGGALQDVVDVYIGSVGKYGNVSIGAYNFWWSLLGDRAWQLQSSDSPFGLLSFGQWGILLFGMLYGLILWIFRKALWEAQNNLSIYYCSALLCAAFFLFLPQMHERYLFPFVVFGIPLIFLSRTIAALYWGMIAAFTLNLMGIMPLSFIDKAFYRAFDTLDVLVASSMVLLFVALTIGGYKLVTRDS